MDINGNLSRSRDYPIDVLSLLPPPEVVSIPDPHLAAAIRAKIGNITTHTMLYLRKLVVPGGITALTGLEHAQNLRELSLSDNSIVDISPLAGLTQLRYLELGGNSISDISPLAGLTQLTRLFLWYNSISDISPLEGLTQLTTLYLNRNSISDVSPLVGLTQLTTLDLSDNSISDVSPLVELNLTGPQWDSPGLYITGNPLNYASVHAHIPAMQENGVEVLFDNRAHSALVKISGDTQKGEAGARLATPFIVKAMDAHDTPMKDLSITFRVIEGGGKLSTTTDTTEANGMAQTTLTLGPNPGVNKVHVTASPITYPVTFTAIATAAAHPTEDVNGDAR